MRYYCTNCNYIYDEIFGDDDLGISPNTAFADLADDFICPICEESTKEDFISIDSEINYMQGRLSNIEKKYYPEIKISKDEISYTISHKNTDIDFIYKVELIDEYGDEIDSHRYNRDSEVISGVFDIEYLDEYEILIYTSNHLVFGVRF